MIHNWLKNKLSGLLPQQCLLCQATVLESHHPVTTPSICSDCENDLAKNHHHCVICSIPFPLPEKHEQTPLVCGKCQKKTPNYTTSVIPHLYTSPYKQLITSFKFNRNLYYAPLLAQTFIKAIKHRHNNLPECIIPVPLHVKRLRERGFNQALELARIIAKFYNIPLDYSLCQRNKETPYQSGLSAKKRKRNLHNAFEVTKTHNYKHIAIFDDVVTTGATVNELAKKLKQSGVEVVEVWAIARTVSKNTV